MEKLIPFLLTLILALLLRDGYAQGTDASISGTVYDEAKTPVPGAVIKVKNLSTGFTTGTVTGADGKYMLRQLPLGGPYTLDISMVGFSNITKTGLQLSLGDNIRQDYNLSEKSNELSEVTVQGTGFNNRNERLASSTSVTAKDLRSLPTPNRSFSTLAQLSPLVGGGTNIFGGNSRNNAFTIDGVNAKEASFGESGASPFTLSMEALREFEVVSNSYDVTEGRGSFGSIKAVTKSGTNQLTGSAHGYFWVDKLAAQKNLLKQDVTVQSKQQFGFTLGGPIIKDKLHFFLTYDAERLKQPFDLWQKSTTPGIVQNNRGEQATKENLDRAISILQDKYEVMDRPQYGFFSRKNQLDTFFGKLDWQINDKHKLTLRTILNNYIAPTQNNSDIGNYGIYDASYDFYDKGNNTMLALRSQFKPNLLNELKIGYYFNERGNKITTAEHPQLWVAMQSVIDGKEVNATLVGRYNRWTPETQRNKIWTIVNDTYWTRGKFDFVFGTQNTITVSSGIYTHDIKGRFDFNSIDALDKMEPDRYRRKFQNPGQELNGLLSTTLIEASLYAQATTEILPNLKASLGLRYDAAIFTQAPDYNPLLEKELGYRNDKKPVDLNNLQPRLNINWDVKGKGRDIVSLGAGFFNGQFVTRPYIYSLIDNGIRFTQIDISKGQKDEAGNVIILPKPDYAAYDKDKSTIPGTAYSNAVLFPSRAASAQVIRFVDKNLQLPNTFKAHFSYHRYINPWLRAGISFYSTKTWNMLTMENVNLRKTASFTLNGEGGREVYTPIDKMGAKAAVFADARISNSFSQALMFTNGYKTSFAGAVVDFAFQLPKEGKLNVSYTRAVAKGAERYNNEDDRRFIGKTYFDNYAFINGGYSPEDFRHKVLVNLTSPNVAGFTIGLFYSGLQRGRFSAEMSNADYSGTDTRQGEHYAAYIWDPNDPSLAATQGETFANDYKAMWNAAEPWVREYLQKNIGRYAQPFGGILPWSNQWNIRLMKEIKFYKTNRLQLSIDVFNFANLVSDRKGGFTNIVNTQMYSATAFDKATQQYKYQVNKTFGTSRYEGTGFSTMIGVKYLF